MKTKRYLAMVVVAFAAAVALSLAPAPAFADTGDSPSAPDIPLAEAGEAGAGDGGMEADGFSDSGNTAPDSEIPDLEANANGGADNESGDGDGEADGDADGEAGGGVNGEAGDGDEEADGNADGEAGDGDEEADGNADGEAGDDADDEDGDGDADGESGESADGENDGDMDGEADGDEEADADVDGEADADNQLEAGDGNEADAESPEASAEDGDTATIAVASAAVDKGASTKAAATNGNGQGAAESGQPTAKNLGASGAVGDLGEINVALLLVEGAISGTASGPVSWASGKILTAIFGSNITGDVEEKLNEILRALDEIRNAIADLQKTVDAQELDNILNSMKNLIDADKTDLIMTNLKSLDEAKYSPEEYKERMKSVLTEGMANGTLTDFGSIGSPFNIFDTYVSDLWIAMTTPYEVTINNQSQELTLMQVYYEHLRLKYKWEHMAYEEWEAFNNKCVGLLAASLGLERVSLKARLDLLREYNATHTDKHDEGAVIALLNKTQDSINQMKGYDGTYYEETRNPDKPAAKTVLYPGLFNKQAWDEQYWMYKERPDYRYYWVPGHECLFYAQVNTQDIPWEDTLATLRDPSTYQGVKVTRSGGDYHVEIRYDHWKPFLSYQGGDSPLASETQLKNMYKDYRSDKHLYNIFIDPDEGNFLGLDEGDITHWWFVVGQTDDHHLTLEENDSSLYVLYTYVVSSPHATQDTIDLARYGEYGTWWNSNSHYIGIGVVRYGPETYKPRQPGTVTVVDETKYAKAEVHTTVLYDSSLWWPSYGNLSLGYGCEAHGDVDAVYMDGVKLNAACYAIEGNQIILTRSYLAGLGYGEHKLYLDTKEGGHTIVFETQADGVYYVESGEGSAWTQGSSNPLTFVFKRTMDDSQTFQRLMDVLVDGASVPLWGYAAHAGSAVITLTAGYLATLAPGAHTLTTMFHDGNSAQTTFTVHAASNPQPEPTPVSYGSSPTGQIPATGDSSGMVVPLLVALALAMGLIAVFARRRARSN